MLIPALPLTRARRRAAVSLVVVLPLARPLPYAHVDDVSQIELLRVRAHLIDAGVRPGRMTVSVTPEAITTRGTLRLPQGASSHQIAHQLRGQLTAEHRVHITPL